MSGYGTRDWRPRKLRDLGQKLALGLLALALVAAAGLPVVAKGPRHQTTSTHRQEQTLTAEQKGRKQGGKFKTVAKMFTNSGTIFIPDSDNLQSFDEADPYPSSIQVAGFKNTPRITDVDLALQDIGHEEPADVEVLLVAPNGRNAIVMAGVGDDPNISDDGVNGLLLTLDDEAALELPASAILTAGTFRPNDAEGGTVFPAPAPTPGGDVALSTFDGINPNGQWQLFVNDGGAGDVGAMVEGWSLTITARVRK